MFNLLLPLILALPACAKSPAAAVVSTHTAHVPIAVSTSAAHVPEAIVSSTAPINIIYPEEGYVHPPTRGARIMGWVSRPKAKFRINGQAVNVHRLGGFLAYLPIVPGTFTFHCELDLPNGATSFNRIIYVTQPLKPDATNQAIIDPEPMQPSSNLELRPGDWLRVEMKGTPGSQVRFQIQGRRKLSMAETNPGLGLYRGAYQIRPTDVFDSAAIYFYLAPPHGSSKWAAAKGRLTVRDEAPAVAVVKSSGPVNVRVEPGEAFVLFPPIGTKFLTAGHVGVETLLHLSPALNGSVSTAALQFLPQGTPPPHASLGTIKTEAGPDSTFVILNLTDTVPFIVDSSENPDAVTVRLFYTADHTNWIVYDPADSFIHDIAWKQENFDTTAVTIRLNGSARLWGYHAQWDNGALRLDLRHPPILSRNASVFANRVILLDPGHMPSAPGAIGPRGTLEKDVNLAIAKEVKRLLRDAGAKPILTREGDDEVSLNDRPKIAREKHGDLFVSIHANSMPDGEDPFERPMGFSIFYYHPHSLALAQSVHRAYQRNINLFDDGLRYGDLLVARLTEMPAILTESAYLIFPEQEALLSALSFQKRLARAIFSGLRDFLESERQRQQRTHPAAVKSPAKRT